jgi:hypothetical protein
VYSEAQISQFLLLHIYLTRGWLLPEFSTQNLKTDFVEKFGGGQLRPYAVNSLICLWTIFPKEAIPHGAGNEGIMKRLIKELILALNIETKAFDFRKDS